MSWANWTNGLPELWVLLCALGISRELEAFLPMSARLNPKLRWTQETGGQVLVVHAVSRSARGVALTSSESMFLIVL